MLFMTLVITNWLSPMQYPIIREYLFHLTIFFFNKHYAFPLKTHVTSQWSHHSVFYRYFFAIYWKGDYSGRNILLRNTVYFLQRNKIIFYFNANYQRQLHRYDAFSMYSDMLRKLMYLFLFSFFWRVCVGGCGCGEGAKDEIKACSTRDINNSNLCIWFNRAGSSRSLEVIASILYFACIKKKKGRTLFSRQNRVWWILDVPQTKFRDGLFKCTYNIQ